MKVREILRILKEDGWFHVRTKGSHHHYRHPTKPGTVTVPGNPNHDLNPKTLGSIFKQTEWAGRGERTMKYAVIVEEGPNNYSAYVPDLPGCVSTGETYDEAMRNIREAIEGHLSVMREFGDPIPPPVSQADCVEIAG
jgi:predicted RNA binding protein YcfA (HicA-like mRNA interferase family)/predicted RNase H-like HicB family nuclease